MKNELKEKTAKILFKMRNNKVVGRTTLYLKKESPKILMGVGIVSVVGATVLACKATLKVEDVLDEVNEKLDAIKDVREKVENGELQVTYDEKTCNRDKAIIYIQSGVKLVKLYLPAITLGVAGIGCILGSHNIMQKRNVALMALYKGLEESFEAYRKRVVEEYGEEVDRDFKLGIRRNEITKIETDENGKKKKIKEEVKEIDQDGLNCSQYARFFDELSPQWHKIPDYNLMFLRNQQNYANDLLKARGHIFLNEVYDMLGIPRSQAGAVVGWVLNGDGDGYVDFGMYNINNGKAREFVNGTEPAILLDFNVDGVIYDLI